MGRYDAIERRLAALVAERTGTDADTDLYPGLIAAAAMAAVRTAITVWAGTGAEPGQLPEIVEAAFDQTAEGLAAPSSTTARRGAA